MSWGKKFPFSRLKLYNVFTTMVLSRPATMALVIEGCRHLTSRTRVFVTLCFNTISCEKMPKCVIWYFKFDKFYMQSITNKLKKYFQRSNPQKDIWNRFLGFLCCEQKIETKSTQKDDKSSEKQQASFPPQGSQCERPTFKTFATSVHMCSIHPA